MAKRPEIEEKTFGNDPTDPQNTINYLDVNEIIAVLESHADDIEDLQANGGGNGEGGSYDDTALKARVTAVENNKVDKVNGKVLSTNDYTTLEKTKLAGIDLSTKVDKIANKGLSTNDYTDAEKTKLAGLNNTGGSTTDASQLITGTLSDARLSSKVPLKGSDNKISKNDLPDQPFSSEDFYLNPQGEIALLNPGEGGSTPSTFPICLLKSTTSQTIPIAAYPLAGLNASVLLDATGCYSSGHFITPDGSNNQIWEVSGIATLQNDFQQGGLYWFGCVPTANSDAPFSDGTYTKMTKGSLPQLSIPDNQKNGTIISSPVIFILNPGDTLFPKLYANPGFTITGAEFSFRRIG